MVEIFYPTQVPNDQRDERTEYYKLVCMPAPQEMFVVMQKHGWWDTCINCSRCDEIVLATVDLEVEAKRVFEEQRARLLKTDFIPAKSDLWTVPAPAAATGLVGV